MRSTRLLGGVLAGVLAAAVGATAQPPAAAPPTAPPLPGGAGPGTAAVPATAAPATAAPGTTAAAGAAAPAAAPRNIWGFFMMTPEQKAMKQQNMAMCRSRFCASRIGQFVNNMLLPAGAATGGLLGPVCPGPLAPNAADLQKPATSPQGAAARIKAEEAQAAAKVEAIEFLATVDCRYYPEAEAALIAGLRAEKNECVRLAAAKALATGCCCTPKIVKALTHSVNCSKADGFPAEASELVRLYAYVALERCLRKCVEAEPDVPPEPPAAAKQALYETLTPFGPLADHTTAVLVVSYFAPGGTESPEKVYADGRQALAKGLKLSPQTLGRVGGPKNVRDAVVPGLAALEPIRPAEVLGRLDPRRFVTTLPTAEPVAADPVPGTPPREIVVTVAAPPEPGKPVVVRRVPDPPAGANPGPRAGRGDLMHIFQDARKR